MEKVCTERSSEKGIVFHPELVRGFTELSYLMHYLLEAYRLCGMEEQLIKMIHRYWGGMIRRGADTCWEVFREDDDFFSPYGNSDPRNNSACHAWSGTPGYFLRTSPVGVPR